MKCSVLSTVILGAAALAAAGCSQQNVAPDSSASAEPAASSAPSATLATPSADVTAALAEVSAGEYDVEKTHAFLFWSVSHLGRSNYIAKFKNWDATIDFNPADPASSTVTATIDPTSVETDYPSNPNKTKEAWHDELANDPKFFNAKEFPQISFKSTNIELTGGNTGAMTGDLTFLGVTKPVTLDVTFNGAGNSPWFGERDIIGFSAKGKFSRSDFGLTNYVDIGVGDEVSIAIEAEFLQKETPAPAAEPAAETPAPASE